MGADNGERNDQDLRIHVWLNEVSSVNVVTDVWGDSSLYWPLQPTLHMWKPLSMISVHYCYPSADQSSVHLWVHVVHDRLHDRLQLSPKAEPCRNTYDEQKVFIEFFILQLQRLIDLLSTIFDKWLIGLSSVFFRGKYPNCLVSASQLWTW